MGFAGGWCSAALRVEFREFDPTNSQSIAKIKDDFLSLCKDKGIEETKIAMIKIKT